LRALRALRLDGLQPIGCSVEAVATMIGCFPTQALAFSPVFIQTQRTQRKRLRLDGNRASAMSSTDHITSCFQIKSTVNAKAKDTTVNEKCKD